MRAMVALGLVFVTACKQEVLLEGQVVDIWGSAVPEATIIQDGSPNSTTSDAHGYFTLPMTVGTVTLRVGKEGYIQDQVTFEVPEGGPEHDPVVSLYERPSEHGFFVVDSSQYARLDPEPVVVIGNDLAKVSGVRSIERSISKSPFEVVFDTELRMDEIARLGLSLHRLSYKSKVSIPGPFAAEEVSANLYMSDGEIPLVIAPMRSRNAFRITAETPLEPGWYAFQIQDVLAPEDGTALDDIPDAQKVAWAFEYRG